MLGASSYHVKPHEPAALRQFVATLNAYWVTCEVPEVDSTGKQLETDSAGKLGERFSQLATNPTPRPKAVRSGFHTAQSGW